MTRLISEWIAEMEEKAAAWNEELITDFGAGYVEIASAVSGKSIVEINEAATEHKVAVIPITCGQGTIEFFSESVAAIVRAMGFDAFVTKASDVNGIYEAHTAGADIIFMADDDRYIALNLKNGKIGDNNIATGRGFAEMLSRLAGDLKEKETVVLGYGIIGKIMADYFSKKGAVITVFDKNNEKKEEVLKDGYKWMDDIEGIGKFRYVADGTSEGGWLSESMLSGDALIAAPGIPLSLDESSAEKLKGRYVHDLLEIGTAVMLGLAL